MIELKNITFSYEGRNQGGLRDINLTVKDGSAFCCAGGVVAAKQRSPDLSTD